MRSLLTPATGRRLAIVVPGLCGFAGASTAPGGPDVPALENFLARADRQSLAVAGLDALLFALFAIDTPTDADLPVAAVTRVLDMGVIDKGWWMRADPVYLQPDRDRLILADNEMLRLTQAEADALAAEIMQTFSADGWVLKAARPGRWYLKPPRAARIRTTPLAQLVGRDIHPYLPQGKEGKHWHTVLNEVQILLHTAAVNAEREARGLLPANSLWFWGSGRLPSLAPVEWTQVWSQEPISLALARLTGVGSQGLPADYADWSRRAGEGGAHLVVLDQAYAAVQYREPEAWAAFLRELDGKWLAPAYRAVKQRQLQSVTLYDDQGRGYRLTSRSARRWWRRRVNLERSCQ